MSTPPQDQPDAISPADEALDRLADFASAAHARFQQAHRSLDPVVGVSRQMRSQGVPADLVTIDCLQSGKRIILILHDQQPNRLNYQFARRDGDTPTQFDTLPLTELDADKLYGWMRDFFVTAHHH